MSSVAGESDFLVEGAHTTKRAFVFTELQALAELLGAYGMKHLGQKMMLQVASQVGEIKVREILNFPLRR